MKDKPNKKAINKIKNIYLNYKYYFTNEAIQYNIVLMLILEGNLNQEQAYNLFQEGEKEVIK